MKSQDILVMLKLVILSKTNANHLLWGYEPGDEGWIKEYALDEDTFQRFDQINAAEIELLELYTVRGLAESLGISKSEVSNSIKRMIDVNLVSVSRIHGKPMVNTRHFLEFIQYGLRYVFPAKPGAMVRGIPTTHAAPILRGKLMSAGELKLVWPDPQGIEMGQEVQPLFKSVPQAVRKDPTLYAYLALVDSIRLGNPREKKLAMKLLTEMFENAQLS